MLAPLALLLVLEARCTHFVIANFINIVCCGVVHPSLLPHSTYTNLSHVTKMRVNITVIVMGNSSAHVLGRRQFGFIVIRLILYLL